MNQILKINKDKIIYAKYDESSCVSNDFYLNFGCDSGEKLAFKALSYIGSKKTKKAEEVAGIVMQEILLYFDSIQFPTTVLKTIEFKVNSSTLTLKSDNNEVDFDIDRDESVDISEFVAEEMFIG